MKKKTRKKLEELEARVAALLEEDHDVIKAARKAEKAQDEIDTLSDVVGELIGRLNKHDALGSDLGWKRLEDLETRVGQIQEHNRMDTNLGDMRMGFAQEEAKKSAYWMERVAELNVTLDSLENEDKEISKKIASLTHTLAELKRNHDRLTKVVSGPLLRWESPRSVRDVINEYGEDLSGALDQIQEEREEIETLKRRTDNLTAAVEGVKHKTNYLIKKKAPVKKKKKTKGSSNGRKAKTGV